MPNRNQEKIDKKKQDIKKKIQDNVGGRPDDRKGKKKKSNE